MLHDSTALPKMEVQLDIDDMHVKNGKHAPVKGPNVRSIETSDWPRPLTAPILCGCAELEIIMKTDTKVISEDA
jgi:hypothetical protein